MSARGYLRYVEDVKGGKIIVGRYMRLAVSRFESWLLRDDVQWRREPVERVIDFFSLLSHFNGKHAGEPFLLEPWQQFIIACIYGFYDKKTGRRLCNNVYIEIARKNGKTAFAAGLCLYHLIADGEAGAEVDLAANSKEQAKIAFDFCAKFARGLNTEKKTYLRPFRDRIFFDMQDAKLYVFASDSTKLDGFGASMYLLDEFHAAPDSRLREVLKSSQGQREDPLEVIITSAGFNLSSPCYEYREMCGEVLEGLSEDDNLWAFIFSLDEDDNWEDPSVWVKANPNLGKVVSEFFLSRQVRQALNDRSQESGVKTKNFNLWLNTSEVWIPDGHVMSSLREGRLLDFVREDDAVFVGIDLSSTCDLSAVSYLIPREDAFYFWVDYYLPSEALSLSPHREKYRRWVRGGHLTLTPGNVIDYDYILRDLLAVDKAHPLEKIGYDDWNATQFVIQATKEGLPMLPYGQNIGNFNRPTKEFERLILSSRVRLHSNPVTLFCLRNVVLRYDHNGNAKPDKSKEERKIDGVVAMLEALGVHLREPQYSISV